MNIKHVSLLIVMLIVGFTGIQARYREVYNKEEITTLHELSKIEYEKALNRAQQHPLYDTYEAATDKCLFVDVCRKCPEYQKIAAEWFETSEGKDLEHFAMRSIGLYKMQRYLEAKPGRDDVDSLTSAIHSALYIDTGSTTTVTDEIRHEVEKELCGVIKSNVPLEEIIQELER